MGAAVTHADNATILKIESRGIALTSRVFGYASVGFNALDWFQNPNWQDAGQIALGN